MKPSDMSVNKSAFSQPGRFALLANENVKIGRIKRWMLERDLTWRQVRHATVCKIAALTYRVVLFVTRDPLKAGMALPKVWRLLGR